MYCSKMIARLNIVVVNLAPRIDGDNLFSFSSFHFSGVLWVGFLFCFVCDFLVLFFGQCRSAEITSNMLQ